MFDVHAIKSKFSWHGHQTLWIISIVFDVHAIKSKFSIRFADKEFQENIRLFYKSGETIAMFQISSSTEIAINFQDINSANG